QRWDVNPDTLRKARQFADPVEGYTAKELKELCVLIDQVQSCQDPRLPLFTKTHVIRLLSVRSRTQRKHLQQKAVRQAWSIAQLKGEIAKRYGTRREGGRRRYLP